MAYGNRNSMHMVGGKTSNFGYQMGNLDKAREGYQANKGKAMPNAMSRGFFQGQNTGKPNFNNFKHENGGGLSHSTPMQMYQHSRGNTRDTAEKGSFWVNNNVRQHTLAPGSGEFLTGNKMFGEDGQHRPFVNDKFESPNIANTRGVPDQLPGRFTVGGYLGQQGNMRQVLGGTYVTGSGGQKRYVPLVRSGNGGTMIHPWYQRLAQ